MILNTICVSIKNSIGSKDKPDEKNNGARTDTPTLDRIGKKISKLLESGEVEERTATSYCIDKRAITQPPRHHDTILSPELMRNRLRFLFRLDFF